MKDLLTYMFNSLVDYKMYKVWHFMVMGTVYVGICAYSPIDIIIVIVFVMIILVNYHY